MDEFYARGTQAAWPLSVPVAFPHFSPHFNDIDREAGLPGYNGIANNNGQNYCDTLTRALKSPARVVQIATWNDWGEGTRIEPSQEFGFRDLEATQAARKREWQADFAYTPADLRLPVQLFEARRFEVTTA